MVSNCLNYHGIVIQISRPLSDQRGKALTKGEQQKDCIAWYCDDRIWVWIHILLLLPQCRAQKLSESQELFQRGPVPCPWGRNAKQPLVFPSSLLGIMPMQWSFHKCPINMPRFRKLPDWQKGRKESCKADTPDKWFPGPEDRCGWVSLCYPNSQSPASSFWVTDYTGTVLGLGFFICFCF